MKTQTIRHGISCDGCDYMIANTYNRAEQAAESGAIVLLFPLVTAEGAADGSFEEFHFHPPTTHDGERAVQHDCFRYWVMNKHTMAGSLRKRDGWSPAEIEAFVNRHCTTLPKVRS